jgi:hypothetical protein
MFDETAEIVDIIHDYPTVQSFRTKFALKYFANVTIPYFAWMIALISGINCPLTSLIFSFSNRYKINQQRSRVILFWRRNSRYNFNSTFADL